MKLNNNNKKNSGGKKNSPNIMGLISLVVWALIITALLNYFFSIASTAQPPEGVDRGSFYFFVTLFDYLYWVGGTLLGGLLGSVIPFSTEGLDFALTALFVVLFLGQLENAGSRIYGLIGTVCSLAVLLLVGADNMVIPSMIVILIVLLIGRKRI